MFKRLLKFSRKEGALPWLLHHEIRLWWRGLRGKWFLIAMAILFGLLIVGPLILWLGIFSRFDDIAQIWMLSPLPAPFLWGAVVTSLFSFFFAFIQAMGQSLIALFDRGDLDLLISSPISSKVIFASRLLSIALEIFLGMSVFIVLPSLVAVLFGFIRLLGVYPTLMGLCLTATCLAMLMTLGLVSLIGARQARMWNQVLASLLMAIFFLLTQLPNLMMSTNTESGQLWRPLTSLFEEGKALSSESWIWFPARAIFFDPGAVLLTFVISGAVFWLTVETLHRTFINGTQQSLTLKQRKPRHTSVTRFNNSLSQVVLLKEWRLILRNPYLLSRTFLSILFFIPLSITLLRGDEGDAIASLSTMVSTVSPFVGGSLTSQLALIGISGEEAPDLLRSSPIKGTNLRRLKLLAVLLPVWLLLSPLFVILIIRGEPWLPALAVFIGATICHALLSLWNARPIALSSLISRQRQNVSNDAILAGLTFISFFAWLFLGFQVSAGNKSLSLVGLSLISILMLIAYKRSRLLGSSLGF